MMVCAHGEVTNFCNDRDMKIIETWSGELCDYDGYSRVLVTDKELTEAEYSYLKGVLFGRGVELISTRHSDLEVFSEYSLNFRKKRVVSRPSFGYRKEGDEVVEIPEEIAVIKRIKMLGKEGKTIREICEDDRVRHTDGRRLSISTIQKILKK